MTLAWAEAAARQFEPVEVDVDRYPTAGALAKAIEPTTIQTPALDYVDQVLVDVDAGVTERVILSVPPQEGKSQRVTRFGALWMLRRNMERRIGIASFEAETANRWGLAIRTDIVGNSGDEGTLDLGMRLSGDSTARGRWQLEGHVGGVYCVGVGGALTGRPIDVMFIDDPIKDAAQADSPIYQQRAWDWFTNVVATRLPPKAPVVLILTRWSPQDLAGKLIAKDAEDDKLGIEGPRWKIINIPAQAEENDPLGRAPGEWLQSTRGRTERDWLNKRREVGPRVWAALYQGRPTPLEGNLFKRASIERNQVDADKLPDMITTREYVDPAFSDDEGADETGRIVMGLGTDGNAYVLADLSERKAYENCAIGSSHATHGTTLVKVELNMLGAKVRNTIAKTLPDQVGIAGINAKGTKAQRAEAIANLVDNNRIKFAGEFFTLVDQLVTWRVSDSESPDRLDAFVHGARDLLLEMLGDGQFVFDNEADAAEVTHEPHDTFTMRHDPAVTGLDFSADRDALAGTGVRSPYV